MSNATTAKGKESTFAANSSSKIACFATSQAFLIFFKTRHLRDVTMCCTLLEENAIIERKVELH